MKVNGTRKFSNVSSQQVFQAILDPEVLKSMARITVARDFPLQLKRRPSMLFFRT